MPGNSWSSDSEEGFHSRLSSPTCEDLGIPSDAFGLFSHGSDLDMHEGPYFRLRDLVYDQRNPNNPFSPFSRIPLPTQCAEFDCQGVEPAFIRKRNERERDRVRCVNEGYARLRKHLPFERKDKRVSKVETLRAAIRYIQHLKALLEDGDKSVQHDRETTDVSDPAKKEKDC